MKKQIFLVILLLVAMVGSASEKLTLKLDSSGPEHGTLRLYVIMGANEYSKSTSARDSLGKINGSLSYINCSMSWRHYYGKVFVVGEGFDQDRIIMARKGIVNQEIGQTIKEEAGFSHWGFVKKYQIKTPITTYSRISQTPPIVSVKNELIYSRDNNFHFGSVVALFFLLMLGIEIGTAIFYPKEWWKTRLKTFVGLSNSFFFSVVLLTTMIYCLIWSYNVGAPFIYLAMTAILIGVLLNAWRKIFPGKKAKKISVIKAIPG